MNTLTIDYDTVKVGDTAHDFALTAVEDGQTQSFTDTSGLVVKVGDASHEQITTLATSVNADGTLFDSSGNLTGVPAGTYNVELWQTTEDGVTIYPTVGYATITLVQSIQ